MKFWILIASIWSFVVGFSAAILIATHIITH